MGYKKPSKNTITAIFNDIGARNGQRAASIL